MKQSDYYTKLEKLRNLLRKVYHLGYVWTAQDPCEDESDEQPLRMWYAYKTKPEFSVREQMWVSDGHRVKLSQAYSYKRYQLSCILIEEYLNSTLSSRDRVVVIYEDGTQETGFVTHDSRYLPVYLDSGYKFFFEKNRTNMRLLMTRDNQMLPVDQIKPAQVTFGRRYPYKVGTKVVCGPPEQAGMVSFTQGIIESIEEDRIYVRTDEHLMVFYMILFHEEKYHELDVIAASSGKYYSLYVSL